MRQEREQQIAQSAPQMRQQYGNPECKLVAQEIGRLVLGAQPPAPGRAPVRYVDYKPPNACRELVNSQPYFFDEEYVPNPIYENPMENLSCPSQAVEPYIGEQNSLMMLGGYQSRTQGTSAGQW